MIDSIMTFQNSLSIFQLDMNSLTLNVKLIAALPAPPKCYFNYRYTIPGLNNLFATAHRLQVTESAFQITTGKR